jgi:hypothetical protein
MTVYAWHFVAADGRIANDTHHHGRARIVEAGQTLHMAPPIVLCERGLHGSERLIDALKYAPGPIVCRTEHSGEIVRGKDKLASSRRRVVWMLDATRVLFTFAADVAESALLAERTAGREPHADSWAAVEARRAWLRGELNDAGLSAARSAAWLAAWSASELAAGSAAESAYNKMLQRAVLRAHRAKRKEK